MILNIKIERYFGRYRAYVLVEDTIGKFCHNFDDDDFYELSKHHEIRCLLEGDFEGLINSVENGVYNQIVFCNCKIYVDKPNKNKTDDQIKNQFRMKIVKGV